MFRICRDPETGLAVGVMRKRFDRVAVAGEIVAAYDRGDLHPRQNRLTVIEDGIDIEAVPVGDLARIQAAVAQQETESADWSPFVSVFLGPRPAMRLALSLYELLWEQEPYVQGRFFHTESVAVAGQILSVRNLDRVIARVAAEPPLS